ncbi:unnamed protein product [Closterium sp. Yama58-4]|nr:unnamed protein product [Closterium sp. Yama58-4]
MLSRKQLTGSLPTSLANLSALEQLDLSNNRLYGPIPLYLTTPPNLQLLNLRNNQLTGYLPSDWPPSLATLLLDNNYLYGQPALSYCPSTLSLRSNCLSFPPPPSSSFRCARHPQRPLSACLAFCGLVSPDQKPCSGVGTCRLGKAGKPVCECDDGYVNRASPGSCVPEAQTASFSLSLTDSPPVRLKGSASFSGKQTSGVVPTFDVPQPPDSPLQQLLVSPGVRGAWGAVTLLPLVTLFTFSTPQDPCGRQLAFNFSFSFSITPEPTGGAGMGYKGMGKRSVAVEFDTWFDAKSGDPNSNHVGVNVGGNSRSIATASADAFPLNSGELRYVWIVYDPPAPVGGGGSSGGGGGGGGGAAGGEDAGVCGSNEGAAKASVAGRSSVALLCAQAVADTALGVPLLLCIVFLFLPHAGAPRPVVGAADSVYCRSDVSSCPSGITGSSTWGIAGAAAAGGGGGGGGGGGNGGFIPSQFAPGEEQGGGGGGTGGGGQEQGGITGGCEIDACGVGDKNPCGVGTCVNDGIGGYTCVCPPNYYLGTSEFGAPSCAPGDCENFFTVNVSTMWCYHVHPLFSLTLDQFLEQNELLACDKPIPEGTVVNVKPSLDYSPCSVYYTTVQNDTCESIASLFSLTSSCPDPSQPCTTDLLRLNPGLDCSITTAATTTTKTPTTPLDGGGGGSSSSSSSSDPDKSLPTGLSICVERATALLPVCGETVTVESVGNASCAAVLAGMDPPLSALELYRMNPGIYCHRLLPPSVESGFPGSEICVAISMSMTMGSCPRSEVYLATDNDRCSAIQFRFFKGIKSCYKKINGYDCLDRLNRGTRICLPDPVKISQGKCSI